MQSSMKIGEMMYKDMQANNTNANANFNPSDKPEALLHLICHNLNIKRFFTKKMLQ